MVIQRTLQYPFNLRFLILRIILVGPVDLPFFCLRFLNVALFCLSRLLVPCLFLRLWAVSYFWKMWLEGPYQVQGLHGEWFGRKAHLFGISHAPKWPGLPASAWVESACNPVRVFFFASVPVASYLFFAFVLLSAQSPPSTLNTIVCNGRLYTTL